MDEYDLKTILIVAVILGLLTGYIAWRKGEFFWSWFFGGALIFIVYFPMAVFMRPNKEELDRRRMAKNEEMRCPWCQEFISVHALVCPHCRRDVRSTVSEAGYVGSTEPRAASDNSPLERHSTVPNQVAEEQAKPMREIFPKHRPANIRA